MTLATITLKAGAEYQAPIAARNNVVRDFAQQAPQELSSLFRGIVRDLGDIHLNEKGIALERTRIISSTALCLWGAMGVQEATEYLLEKTEVVRREYELAMDGAPIEIPNDVPLSSLTGDSSSTPTNRYKITPTRPTSDLVEAIAFL